MSRTSKGAPESSLALRATPTRVARWVTVTALRFAARHAGAATVSTELARGTDPSASPELRLRAQQLRSRAERSRLANALVEALGDARGPNLGAFRAKTRQRHAEIREHAEDLLALALRLRDDQTIDVRGAAMTAPLVHHGASPLLRDSGQELGVELRAARAALDATHRGTQGLGAAA